MKYLWVYKQRLLCSRGESLRTKERAVSRMSHERTEKALEHLMTNFKKKIMREQYFVAQHYRI